MHRSTGHKGPPAVSHAKGGLHLLCSESFHCRECHSLVSPFERTCPRCGASGPVVVSIKPLLLPIGVCMVALIFIFLVC
jgi:hypothetical protein